ncbi:MAG TPA: NAD(P)/FAD-dependent oxidoreductase [Candidatus Limnocylindrales bacterium]|nr:NAD(P)/FAD-dependent oxidoreductase [Candidatus Limnocylindrales bacterium]
MIVDDVVDVAIVGAGLAGTTLATRLARRGVDVLVLERSPAWHWRAGGVFASPAAVEQLRRVGLSDATIPALAEPIPAMRLETPAGTTVRLTYGADTGGPMAVGFDRSALDPELERLAIEAGAIVERGVTVHTVHLGAPNVLDLGDHQVAARIVVGADGTHSVVARAAGVARPPRLPPRVGLTWHVNDPRPPTHPAADARMVVGRDGYVGLARVPGGRLNIGVVLGESWLAALADDGAAATAERLLEMIPRRDDDPVDWGAATVCDTIAGASPLGVRVTRRAGPGWFLVGDACGFLDPFTGEGIHRALVSTDLAARAIAAALPRDGDAARAADAYDRAMTRRFGTKDAVSLLVQTFLARPRLFEYAARRLAERPDVRATMGLVMGDLLPASRGLDPRFLAALLAP